MDGPRGQDEVQLGEAEEGKVRHGADNVALRKQLLSLNLILSMKHTEERLTPALSPPFVLRLGGSRLL